MTPTTKLGAFLIAGSLGINVALVAAGVTVYAISPGGIFIWGAFLYGVFLVSRDLYRRFK